MKKNNNRTRYLMFLLLLTVFVTAIAQVSGLRIGNYVLVSKTRVSVLEYRLTYKANLINGSTTNVTSATAKLLPIFNIAVTDNQLSFGAVAAGKSITSTDTFTIRWPISQPISSQILERILVWTITTTNNAAPVANAGPDQTVAIGSTVNLDGTASSDLDGDPLTYQWSITTKPTDSAAALTNPTSSTPNFVVDKSGQYTVRLVVNDGKVSSSADIVIISTLNSAPIANAGADQTIFVNDAVTLDGTGSTDVDGDPLTYRWSITSSPTGSGATLTNPTTAHPTFTADKPGDYAIQLIVNDGTVDSAVESVTVSTKNSAPIANAGADQSVVFNSLVTLDGIASKDVDQNPLTYRWSIISKPPLSTAELANGTTASPTFTADKAGSYTVQLIVNDGTVDSQPDQVIISTQNTRPVANAGQDQSVTVGSVVNLDGSGSTDAEGDTLTYQWSILSAPTGSVADLVDAQSASPSFTPLIAGEYITQLIVNDGQLASEPDTATINVAPVIVNRLPTFTSSPIATATVATAYSYDADATDPDGDTITYSLTTAPTGMTIDSVTGVIAWTPNATGNVPVIVKVADAKGASVEQSYTISVSDPLFPVPDVVGLGKNSALKAISDGKLAVGNVTEANSATVLAGKVISQTPAAGSNVAAGTVVSFVVSTGPVGGGGLPPLPEDVAPPVDPTVVTTTFAASEFIYQGSNPIQTGMAAGTIDPKRAAVIKGRILDRANNPISGVKVTIHSHNEYGQTLSRIDGKFDLVVNGNGPLTIDYEKVGYLPVQRQAATGWQEYSMIDDIIMIQLDGRVTGIDLAAPDAIQVARGSPMTDVDGTRQITMMFPQGTQAAMTLPDGSSQPLTSLHARATEYTVGDNGPNAMPGELPPTSAYTEAFELSVDEAIAANATNVTFNQKIPVYLENFLEFPVGWEVPLGYYDRQKAEWLADQNGRVIKILSINGGLVGLDTTGDDIADDGADLGITQAEREQLATLYTAGQSLWRIAVDHFTPWDANWGVKPPDEATHPTLTQVLDQNNTCTTNVDGSIIECENQTLGEQLPISGSGLSLNYRSDRVPGRALKRTVHIDLSKSEFNSKIVKTVLEVTVAGQRRLISEPSTRVQFDYVWDGLDGQGRPVYGSQLVHYRVGFVYLSEYIKTPGFSLYSLPRVTGEGPTVGPGGRDELTFWTEYETKVLENSQVFRRQFVGGWSLSNQHYYDPIGRKLYLGDGSRRDIAGPTLSPIMKAFLQRKVESSFPETPIPIQYAQYVKAMDVEVDPDGKLCVSDTGNGRIRCLFPDGLVRSIAGNGTLSGPLDDGQFTTNVSLTNVNSIAFGKDGTLYLADGFHKRIRKIGKDNIISTVAGGGTSDIQDGLNATDVALDGVTAIDVSNNGEIYIASNSPGSRIYKVDPNGTIVVLAGAKNVNGYSGDGGLSAAATLNNPVDIKVADDGNVYISDRDNYRVRQISPSGIITTVAGNGTANTSPTSSDALTTGIRKPYGLAFSPTGQLLICESLDSFGGFGEYNNRVLALDNGIMIPIAGGGTAQDVNAAFNGNFEERPATAASLFAISPNKSIKTAVTPDNKLFILGETTNTGLALTMFEVRSPLPGFLFSPIQIPSADGSEVYEFNAFGRHLRTFNAYTNATIDQFNYDTSGRLAKVTDAFGNIITLERDGNGNPTAIVAPFGQRNQLTVDANGYLNKITNPANESYQMTYTASGLLTRFTNPRGNSSTMAYDTEGRLLSDTNAEGGGTALSLARTSQRISVTLTGALNRAVTHIVETLSTGEQGRTSIYSDGTKMEAKQANNGTSSATLPDSTTTSAIQRPDPRFSMLSPMTISSTVQTGGLTATQTHEKTVTLSNPDNPLSLTSMLDVSTVNGRSYRTDYDAVGRVLTNRSPVGRTLTTNLDNFSRVTRSQMSGLLAVNNTYDTRGRLATVTQGTGVDSRQISFAYNPEGYLSSVTNPLGRVVSYTYDPAGKLIQSTLPDGRKIDYSYDANGNLTSLAPPGRSGHLFRYTAIDQNSHYIPPDIGAGSNQTLYTYDLDKALTRIDRPDGQAVNLVYDIAGRLSKINLGDGVTARTLDSYLYDAVTGKLKSITTADGGTLNFTYNGGLLTETAWTGDVAGAISGSYDNNFRIISMSVNGVNPISFGYDNDSLLTKAGAMSLTYSPINGLLSGITLGSITDSFTYSNFGETSAYTANISGTAAFNTTFTRDLLGRITRKLETTNGITTTFDYAYDTAGRLVEVKQNNVVTASYSYDSNGNRLTGPGLTVPPTYDEQDRLLTYGNIAYSYNANGDLASKSQGISTTSYQYDVLGNLSHVTLPGGTNIDYLVDGRDRRIGKKVDGVLVQGFLYQDQLKPIAELDGNNAVVSRFVYATKANVPDYMVKGGVTYRIITDHLGSPRLVINTTTGTIAQRMAFDEFGNVIQDTNPGFQPFGFAGGLYDTDTGLVRFGARDYDAVTGRWNTKDPIGFGGGSNLYAYVINNPQNLIDPQGLGFDSYSTTCARNPLLCAEIAGTGGTAATVKDEVVAAVETAGPAVANAVSSTVCNASQAISQVISTGSNREMLQQALNITKSVAQQGGSVVQRVKVFSDLSFQITRLSGNSWHSTLEAGLDYSFIFAGTQGGQINAVIFSPNGKIFIGDITNRAQFIFGANGTLQPVYDALKQIF